jgi:chromosome segregation ATPase
MGRGKFMMLMVGLTLGALSDLKAQSKKEIIQLLTRQVDSLQKVLEVKSGALQQLEVKLARLEGAAEVNNGLVNRMENKADSLRDALLTRNAIIETQKAQIAKLTTDVNSYQEQQKDWTTKNEAMAAELKTLKDKTSPAIATTTAAAPKENKVAVTEVPKEAAKPAATPPVNKTEP